MHSNLTINLPNVTPSKYVTSEHLSKLIDWSTFDGWMSLRKAAQ